MARTTLPGLTDWRCSGRSVSGRRIQIQTATSRPSNAITQKIHRQPATSNTACPMLGAIIGTTMNTIPTMDCSRAMRSPSKRSRMIAAGSTTSPALATPSAPRRISNTAKLVTDAHAAVNAT